MDAVVLAVYISLSISWLLRCSGCDLWPTFRPTCAHLWEVLHVSRLICSTARWLGGVRVSGGGGCDNVLSTTFLTFFVILQHPTRSWCYVMELVLATSHTNRVSWSSTRLQRPFHASPPTKIWASYVFCPSFPLNGKTFCCSCESCEKNHSQRKTPYLQAQKSQWSSEHKELRSASATSESCFQWVLGWCRIFLGSSQRSDSEVETREAHRFCRWLPGAAKSSWSCQDSKFERYFPSPLHMDAAGHPPQKRYDPRLCDTAAQSGARWDGKRKTRQFHIGSRWQCGWRFGKCLERTAETDGPLVNHCAWQDRAPQSAMRALLEKGAWLGTRSSSSSHT